MNLFAQKSKEQNKLTPLRPSDHFKILEYLDEDNSMFFCKRFSDSKKVFVKTAKVVNDQSLLKKKFKVFQDLKEFLLKTKIKSILSPDNILVCQDPDSSSHVQLWRVFESFDYVLWNQYYTCDFRLQKKYVIRHFNETEILLILQSLVSSLVLLFSKGKIPSFYNFFVCLSDQKYKLYFDSFDDIRQNPVLSFVDFDNESQKLAIKRVIHKKSHMPPPQLSHWEKFERNRRKSRREQMRSLKQMKLRKKTGSNCGRVKSLKRDISDMENPKYADLDLIVPQFQIPQAQKKPPQPREFVDRVQKRYLYVRQRLIQNLFSSFLVSRFENLLDYAIILIYGFLKDVVFAFYNIQLQNTEALRKLYQQDKLDQFKNLLGLFFFLLQQKTTKAASTPKLAGGHTRSKPGTTSPRKFSEQTAVSEDKTSILTGGVFNSSIQELKSIRSVLLGKLDHFFRVSQRVMKEFLGQEIEFPSQHWHYLRYPVFMYMQRLSLVYSGGQLEEGRLFQNLANILSNLVDLKYLTLNFSE